MNMRSVGIALAGGLMWLGVQAWAGFGFFADGGSYVIIDVNGGGNTYYHLSPTSGANPAFHNTNLGTFETGVNTLVLNGFENNTFENANDGVMNGNLSYRIYLDGAPSGAYTIVSHTSFTDLGSGNKQHFVTDSNINILAGLPSGDYVLELYNWAEVDYNIGGNPGDGSPDDEIYADNTDTPDATLFQSAAESPFLFQANFTVDNTAVTPEPGTAGLLIFSMGVLRLIRRRGAAS